MTQNLPKTTNAGVEYKWDVTGAPDVEQKPSGERLLRVRPRVLSVSRSRYREGLAVYIEGRQVRLDGELGPHNRAVSYDTEEPSYRKPDPALRTEAMPEWARPYLEQAQAWEAKR